MALKRDQSVLFSGERSEKRIDVEEYQFLDLQKDVENGEAFRMILINKSESGFCCLYIGKHQFFKDECLKMRSGKSYQIAWVESHRGASQFLGLMEKKDFTGHPVQSQVVLIDECDSSVIKFLTTFIARYKSMTEKPLSVTVHYVDQSLDKLKHYHFKGPTLVLCSGEIEKVVSAIGNEARELALLSLGNKHWKKSLKKIMRALFGRELVRWNGDPGQKIMSSVDLNETLKPILSQNSQGIEKFGIIDAYINAMHGLVGSIEMEHSLKGETLWLKIRMNEVVLSASFLSSLKDGMNEHEGKPEKVIMHLLEKVWPQARALFVHHMPEDCLEFVVAIFTGDEIDEVKKTCFVIKDESES